MRARSSVWVTRSYCCNSNSSVPQALRKLRSIWSRSPDHFGFVAGAGSPEERIDRRHGPRQTPVPPLRKSQASEQSEGADVIRIRRERQCRIPSATAGYAGARRWDRHRDHGFHRMRRNGTRVDNDRARPARANDAGPSSLPAQRHATAGPPSLGSAGLGQATGGLADHGTVTQAQFAPCRTAHSGAPCLPLGAVPALRLRVVLVGSPRIGRPVVLARPWWPRLPVLRRVWPLNEPAEGR